MTSRGLLLVRMAQKQSNEEKLQNEDEDQLPSQLFPHSKDSSTQKAREWLDSNSTYFPGYNEELSLPPTDSSSTIILETESDEITDDDKDPNFDIYDYVDRSSEDDTILSRQSTNSIRSKSTVLPLINPIIMAEPRQEKKLLKQQHLKKVRCKYCENDVISKNFVRHLERHHKGENEVIELLEHPPNSRERRLALSLLRNDTNFDLFIQGITRPIRQLENDDKEEYYPCVYCKRLFLKNYLKRHTKTCFVKKQKNPIPGVKNQKNHPLSCSQTLTACAMDPTNVISKMNVREKVFDIMKPDHIAFEAKKDLLIAHMGESYLKKHKKECMAYSASNKMRELSRLLIEYRILVNDRNLSFKDIIHPKNFDTIITATREISGYNHETKTFRSPSLAMHIGISLKFMCDELIHLILRQSKGYTTKSSSCQKEWIQNVRFFQELIKSRWNTELGSLANKDLAEKRWNKPLLLPLVSDIHKFREGVLEIASSCQQELLNCSGPNEKAYKLFTQSILALLILFNRRRIRDVQYLKIKDYLNDKKSNSNDFEIALTDAEKVLTTKYKRVVNSGKGNRAVVILVPSILQDFVRILLEHRFKYIPSDNEYLFAMPGSIIKWVKVMWLSRHFVKESN